MLGPFARLPRSLPQISIGLVESVDRPAAHQAQAHAQPPRLQRGRATLGTSRLPYGGPLRCARLRNVDGPLRSGGWWVERGSVRRLGGPHSEARQCGMPIHVAQRCAKGHGLRRRRRRRRSPPPTGACALLHARLPMPLAPPPPLLPAANLDLASKNGRWVKGQLGGTCEWGRRDGCAVPVQRLARWRHGRPGTRPGVQATMLLSSSLHSPPAQCVCRAAAPP